MSNVISFVGRLGADAETKQVGDKTVTEMNIANNVGFGEKETTNWFRFSMWNMSDALVKNLTKGRLVSIIGEFNARKYQTKEGVEKMALEIKGYKIDFVGSKKDEEGGGDAASAARKPESKARIHSAPPSAAPSQSDDEDLPF